MLDLVQLIRDNPNAIFTIDNDCWWMNSESGEELASDGQVIELGDGGYGSGHLYGGDVLQALAKIAGVNIESV